MNVPRNVLWFEALLYMSLILDALSAAFADRTPTAEMTEQMISVGSLIEILLFLFLVWLAARQRKSWPRWVLSGALLLSVIPLVEVVADGSLDFDSMIGMVSCLLTAVGLYCSFTGDAKGWFIK